MQETRGATRLSAASSYREQNFPIVHITMDGPHLPRIAHYEYFALFPTPR